LVWGEVPCFRFTTGFILSGAVGAVPNGLPRDRVRRFSGGPKKRQPGEGNFFRGSGPTLGFVEKAGRKRLETFRFSRAFPKSAWGSTLPQPGAHHRKRGGDFFFFGACRALEAAHLGGKFSRTRARDDGDSRGHTGPGGGARGARHGRGDSPSAARSNAGTRGATPENQQLSSFT